MSHQPSPFAVATDDASAGAAARHDVSADEARSRLEPTTTDRVDPLGDASIRDPHGRLCGWCEEPLSPEKRSDSIYCGQSCRQAAWRFRRPVRTARWVAQDLPLRLAYADPPYPGTARRYYREHPDYGGEVDPAEVLRTLLEEFPDGWALSTSAAALPEVLRLCPPEVRVAAWFRGERPTVSYRPLSAWEPVIFYGGRGYLSPLQERRIDALVHVARARRTDPRHVVGAKPAAFCYWIFDLLGALPSDELVDLFPGSGGITRAWAVYASHGTSSEISVAQRSTTDASCIAGARRCLLELTEIPS